MQQSIWHQSVSLPAFPPLEKSEKTEVLIIGGGMAGLLCAHQLIQAGVDCLLIDAGRICGGVTGNTTAKITSQHGFVYQKLWKNFDRDTALGYWQANQLALEAYGELAGKIPCDFEVRDNLIYSTDSAEPLDEELEAMFRIGIPGELRHEHPLPFPIAGAVCIRDQAQFHPLKLVQGIAGNLNIREMTRVYRIEKGRVFTNRGSTRAEKIIVATHFPILNRVGMYFMKLYQDRSYVLALSGAQKLDGMYLDGSGKGLSFRNQGDALLLGGGSHRTGKPPWAGSRFLPLPGPIIPVFGRWPDGRPRTA